jgi:hypothetical protein
LLLSWDDFMHYPRLIEGVYFPLWLFDSGYCIQERGFW